MSKDKIEVNMNIYDIPILVEQLKELEQENKQLKDSRDWWKDRFFGQQEYDDSHRITAIEYKKRIDKAIEYIKENAFEVVNSEHKTLLNIEELLEILGGDDNGM